MKSKNNATSLNEMLDNPEALLEDQLDESKKEIEKLKEEIKYLEKQIENYKQNDSKAKKVDELEAKNKYMDDTIKTMEKNIEDLKNQKKKLEEDFKEEIAKTDEKLRAIKFDLANCVYEKELLSTKYRRYIEKLKNKLISLGYKFKEKK